MGHERQWGELLGTVDTRSPTGREADGQNRALKAKWARARRASEQRRKIHPKVAIDAAAIVYARCHLVSGKEWHRAIS